MIIDTRVKLLALAEARALPDLGLCVSGYFDPLLKAHADRLARLAAQSGPLTVLVCDPPDPLLPLEARAKLVAGLRCVARVIAVNDVSQLPHITNVSREEQLDLRLRDEFLERVRQRNQASTVTP